MIPTFTIQIEQAADLFVLTARDGTGRVVAERSVFDAHVVPQAAARMVKSATRYLAAREYAP